MKIWFTHFCRRSRKRYHQKPATAGMENRQTVVLQSHLDMVCQKNNDVDFRDFGHARNRNVCRWRLR